MSAPKTSLNTGDEPSWRHRENQARARGRPHRCPARLLPESSTTLTLKGAAVVLKLPIKRLLILLLLLAPSARSSRGKSRPGMIGHPEPANMMQSAMRRLYTRNLRGLLLPRFQLVENVNNIVGVSIHAHPPFNCHNKGVPKFECAVGLVAQSSPRRVD